MVIKNYKNVALELLIKYINMCKKYNNDSEKLKSICGYYLSKLDSMELFDNYKGFIDFNNIDN